jgi:hypothetical protein
VPRNVHVSVLHTHAIKPLKTRLLRHQRISALPTTYTLRDARFRQTAAGLYDTTLRFHSFPPARPTNFHIKHLRIPNTMADFLEKSTAAAAAARTPTANTRIPTTAELPALPGNKRLFQKMGAAP